MAPPRVIVPPAPLVLTVPVPLMIADRLSALVFVKLIAPFVVIATAVVGAKPVIVDVDDARGQALAAELGALYVRCDVGDKAQVDALVAESRGETAKARRAALEVAYNPNDCPERRWGAKTGTPEAATCRRQWNPRRRWHRICAMQCRCP